MDSIPSSVVGLPNPIMNEDGEHTGGVIGSLNSIGYQIRQFNPY